MVTSHAVLVPTVKRQRRPCQPRPRSFVRQRLRQTPSPGDGAKALSASGSAPDRSTAATGTAMIARMKADACRPGRRRAAARPPSRDALWNGRTRYVVRGLCMRAKLYRVDGRRSSHSERPRFVPELAPIGSFRLRSTQELGPASNFTLSTSSDAALRRPAIFDSSMGSDFQRAPAVHGVPIPRPPGTTGYSPFFSA